MLDPRQTWLHGLEPLVERRRVDRRRSDRRSRPTPLPFPDRRAGGERRVRQRRENVTEHLRNALQVLVHTCARPNLPPELRDELEASVRRLWLALQELERPRDRAAG